MQATRKFFAEQRGVSYEEPLWLSMLFVVCLWVVFSYGWKGLVAWVVIIPTCYGGYLLWERHDSRRHAREREEINKHWIANYGTPEQRADPTLEAYRHPREDIA